MVLFVGLGVFSILDAATDAPWGGRFSGLGLIALGVNSFLAPIPLGKPLGSVLQSMREAAIGSESLRHGVTWLALGLLMAGLVLRAAAYLG